MRDIATDRNLDSDPTVNSDANSIDWNEQRTAEGRFVVGVYIIWLVRKDFSLNIRIIIVYFVRISSVYKMYLIISYTNINSRLDPHNMAINLILGVSCFNE